MNKSANHSSELLNNLVKSAQTHTPEPVRKFVIELPEKKEPSLQEVLAQMGDPMGGPAMDMETPLPEEGMEGGEDMERAKEKVCDALLALCGGPEEAKACIDAHCGGQAEGMDDVPPMGEEPIEPSPMEMPAPM